MLSVNGCVHTACAVSHMIILIIKFPNNVVLVQAVLRKYLTVCAAVAIFMDITLSIAWVIHLLVLHFVGQDPLILTALCA